MRAARNLLLRQGLDRTPGFKIEIAKGRLKLHRLFTAHIWALDATGDGKNILVYEPLRELAEKSHVEAELCST